MFHGESLAVRLECPLRIDLSGSILSRFVSLEPIRNIVAEGLITAAIDGLMGVATLAVIFIYSPLLGVVVGLAFLVYLAVRLALYRQFRERAEATIGSKAQENSTLIETLRAIQSLKLFNRESERESQWLNRYASVISAAVRMGRTKILFTTLNEVIFGLENIEQRAESASAPALTPQPAV